ncbi:PREDICTED: uncharacterized protein LOC104799557 [Tarenaya hassleriana]|uniref:uncharacterized protein LOC104799557 n=1 Tax=Tarenaya hassleriana TaxID=28532 RepID=UPI00053C247B|nr:PREDICTED: uncharacterized protein LOC104799557 [Tarenaya hassleriana]XP_010520451.1 PREDICTED: uncharacterized protein LOC104799557 [Tarenaya hassleriana]
MSRPILLVFLLVILIVTSQFEWRQPLVSDLDATPSLSQKQLQASKREESVKEKIILSQERHIQRLNGIVRNLQLQLVECVGQNGTKNATENYNLDKQFIKLDRKHILED